MEIQATEGGVLSEIRVRSARSRRSVRWWRSSASGNTAATPAAPAPARIDSVVVRTCAGRRHRVAGGPIKLDPFLEVRTPTKNYGSGQNGGRRDRDPARSSPCRRNRHRPREAQGLRPGRSHRRERHQIGARLSRRHGGPGAWPGDGGHQVAVQGHALRGSPARRNAEDHRRPPAPGDADRPAFLHRRRRRRRRPGGVARAAQRRRAARPGSEARLQILAQRFHHQGLGHGAPGRPGSKRRLGRGSHPPLLPERCRGCRRDRRRPDHSVDPRTPTPSR